MNILTFNIYIYIYIDRYYKSICGNWYVVSIQNILIFNRSNQEGGSGHELSNFSLFWLIYFALIIIGCVQETICLNWFPLKIMLLFCIRKNSRENYWKVYTLKLYWNVPINIIDKISFNIFNLVFRQV